MIKRRNFFSILEIIIATSLFALILGTTSTLFFRYHRLTAKLETLRPKVLERTLFYEKFLQMSGSITPSSLKEEHSTYQNLLSFEFDNGWKQNPGVAGTCTCKLYKDENNNLVYLIINSKQEEAKRIFLQDISYFKAKWENGKLILHLKDLNGKKLSYQFLIPIEEKA